MEHLHIHNTATKRLERFIPLNLAQVGIYLCGPTVYGEAHLGHARSAITVDVMVRYLRYLGYKVCYVRNITDVGHLTHEEVDEGEDKVGRQAKINQVHPMEIAQRYTNGYRACMGALQVLPPSIEPLATGHIPEQIALVEQLLAKGFAYQVNGSVYFDIAAYEKEYTYGTLSRRNKEEARTGTRLLSNSGEKRSPRDFALWKKATPDHLMQWTSPWGQGFPGWHLECTAMGQKYLGKVFDICAGGLDLLFPHHDCGMAQGIAATGVSPARYWVHNNLVMIDGQKMSKSAGNFITLRQCFSGEHPLLSQAYAPMVIRLLMLQAHYRSPIHFSNDALLAAQKAYYKLVNGLKILDEWQNLPVPEGFSTVGEAIVATCQDCHKAMNEDFNTAKLMAHLFSLRSWIYQVHEGKVSLAEIGKKAWVLLGKTYRSFLQEVLGLQLPPMDAHKDLVEALLAQYKLAKQKQDYPQVDGIRRALQKVDILVHDTPKGVAWSYTS